MSVSRTARVGSDASCGTETRPNRIAAATSERVISSRFTTARMRSITSPRAVVGISDRAAPSARAVRARVTECSTYNLPAVSERLPNTEVPDDTRLELAADFSTVHLEPDVDADRPHWRPVAQTEPQRASQLAEVEVGAAVEDVAAIRKESRSDLTPQRHAQLAVENQHGIPASRESACADGCA